MRSADLSNDKNPAASNAANPAGASRARPANPAGRARRSSNSRYWGLSLAGLLTFFGAWWIAAATGLAPPQFLPTPLAVAEKFIQLLHEPFAGYTLQQHLWSSLLRYLMGFALAAVIGLPLGLLMGWFRWLDYIVAPLFEVVRFIAPIAWVPFAALWFGTGIGGPILIIFTGAFPPCVVNAYRGAKYVDNTLLEAARMLGVPTRMILFEVLLPAATPSIIAGLRVSAGLGWMSLVGAELIVASSGIGYMLVKGQSSINTAIVMSGMIAIGMVGGAIDLVLRKIETLAMRNRPRAHR